MSPDETLRYQRINVFIPENIRIEFVVSLSPGLQLLLQTWVDQKDDRRAALKAAADIAAHGKALQDAVGSATPPAA